MTRFPALLISCIVFFVTGKTSAQAVFTNRSVTPPLVLLDTVAFPGLRAYSLISSADTFIASPGYRFGGSADGAGIVRNTNGTYTMAVNHENNFSASRVTLDSSFTPVSGEYLLNSDAGMWRLCSATLAVPQIHGFGPTFITGAESNLENYAHAIPLFSPVVHDSLTSANTLLAKGLGRWRIENAVPLPLATFNKTVVIITDDDGGTHGGQVAMYIADAVGDLQNGKLYVLRQTNLDWREKSVLPGIPADVEFVEIPGYMAMTGAQIDQYATDTLKAFQFGRPEDSDYRKGPAHAAREIYFTTTGGSLLDTVNRTLWGRLYRLQLDSLNPLHGKLTCVLDGDQKNPVNPGRYLYNPDNVCATEDYVYVQEDPGGFWTPQAAPYLHDACIHQYDIETGNAKTIVMLDHHRHTPDSMIYNTNSSASMYIQSAQGSWEYGAMTDLSEVTGIQNTFMLNIMVKTWFSPLFYNRDGGTLAPFVNDGAMTVTLTGVPRIKAKAPSVPSSTICAGDSVTLAASGGSTFWQTNGTSYNWYTSPSGGTPFFTGNMYTTPALSSSTVYFVEAVVSGDSSVRTPVIIGVNPLPAQPVITVSNFTLTSSASSGNQWFRNNLAIGGATAQQYTVTQSGFYSVQQTIFNCASPMSEDTLIVISGLEEYRAENMLRVSPNPGDGYFHIETGLAKADRLALYDLSGRILFEKENLVFPATLDFGGFENGMYLLKAESAGATYINRLVIRK
ncbi:MAG: hypothetical protein FD123_667 [Bacteroidetes bacterium]|nr:MAG: hypothetical protein FD123_667 [Bacteroidota bacterium]